MNHVYFIGPEWDFGRIKIGITKGSVHARLRALQTGSPFPLKIYAYMAGEKELERVLHQTFAPLRVHGEWFRLNLKLASLITYLEYSGIEDRPVTAQELSAALHDVMECDDPPHPSVSIADWRDSAHADALITWEGGRAWDAYQMGIGAQ